MKDASTNKTLLIQKGIFRYKMITPRILFVLLVYKTISSLEQNGRSSKILNQISYIQKL